MFTAINIRKLFSAILITIGSGVVISLISTGSAESYHALIKPDSVPPLSVFSTVIAILSSVMGAGLYAVWSSHEKQGKKNKACLFLYIQMAFNFLWSILFFKLELFGFAGIWMVILLILSVITIKQFTGISKWAGMLVVPYFIWLLVMAYLNYGIWILNS